MLILVSDHELRSAWIGPSFPLDLTKLPIRSEEIPLQYPSLSMSLTPSLQCAISDQAWTEVGYSSKVPYMNLEDRAALGANVEKVLLKEKDAARAPIP